METNEQSFTSKAQIFENKSNCSKMSSKSKSSRSNSTRSSISRISTTLALKHAEVQAARIKMTFAENEAMLKNEKAILNEQLKIAQAEQARKSAVLENEV